MTMAEIKMKIENYVQDMQKFEHTQMLLNDLKKSMTFNPTLVVFGDQSAGKSSTISRILQKKVVITGSGTTTRCPIEITVQNCPSDSEQRSKHGVKNSDDFCLVRIDDSEMSTAKIAGAGLINPESAKKIQNPKKNTVSFAGAGETDMCFTNMDKLRDFISAKVDSGISMKPIKISLLSKDVDVNITVVDLPGIVTVASDTINEDEIELIEKMLMIYGQKMNCLILVVMSEDRNTSNALKLAKKCDLTGKRTIIVRSKTDTGIENGCDVKKIFSNDYKPDDCIAEIAVRNGKDYEDSMDMRQILEAEQDLFHTRYPKCIRKHGITALRDEIFKWMNVTYREMYVQPIERCLKKIKNVSSLRVEELSKPKTPALLVGNRIVDDFVSKFRKIETLDMTSTDLYGEAAFCTIAQKFEKEIDDLQLDETTLFSDICMAMEKCDRICECITDIPAKVYSLLLASKFRELHPICLSFYEKAYTQQIDDVSLITQKYLNDNGNSIIRNFIIEKSDLLLEQYKKNSVYLAIKFLECTQKCYESFGDKIKEEYDRVKTLTFENCVFEEEVDLDVTKVSLEKSLVAGAGVEICDNDSIIVQSSQNLGENSFTPLRKNDKKSSLMDFNKQDSENKKKVTALLQSNINTPRIIAFKKNFDYWKTLNESNKDICLQIYTQIAVQYKHKVDAIKDYLVVNVKNEIMEPFKNNCQQYLIEEMYKCNDAAEYLGDNYSNENQLEDANKILMETDELLEELNHLKSNLMQNIRKRPYCHIANCPENCGCGGCTQRI